MQNALLSALALLILVLCSAYLLALGGAALFSPGRVRQFLGCFASSAGAHFLELGLRLVVGAALVVAAPLMRFPALFSSVGWVILGTSAVLALVPWRHHRRFAEWAVPLAIRQMMPFGLASVCAGVLLLLAAGAGLATMLGLP